MPTLLSLPEYVRMAADQLLNRALGDLGKASRAALLEQQRQEVDLEQDVAELVDELRVVAGVCGVGELVGLLDRVGNDRALVLLAVPGALAAQAAGDLVEAGERVERVAIHPRRAGPAQARALAARLPAAAAPPGPITPGCWGGRWRLESAPAAEPGLLSGEHGRVPGQDGECRGHGRSALGSTAGVAVKFSQRSIT